MDVNHQKGCGSRGDVDAGIDQMHAATQRHPSPKMSGREGA